MQKQNGFAHALIIPVILIIIVGLIVWRVVSVEQDKQKAQLQNQQETTAPIPTLSADEQEALKAQDGDLPPTPEQTPSAATTQTTPKPPVNNATTGAASAPAPQPPASAPQPSAPPAPTVQRPTAEFCAQKNGASFTNVWFTGNGTYTYDGYAWENGYSYSLPRVSKTETGTPLFNYDTMQTFDVVAYGTQPQWAVCSKAGYVMVYYTVPNSPYTFNALAEYGHLSLQQP